MSRLGGETATDVSEVAAVPRTRVYDAAREFHEYVLVDVQQSTPKAFWPVSTETTGRSFERDVHDGVSLLTTALDELQPPERRTEQRGVWSVHGSTAVTERVLDFSNAAEEEIAYVTIAALLTEPILDRLGGAAQRGVAIKLGGSPRRPKLVSRTTCWGQSCPSPSGCGRTRLRADS